MDSNEDLILIDHTRLFTIFATASREVRRLCSGSEGAVGIPSDWKLAWAVESEVYSIGRTMYLIAGGVEMGEIYKEHGWMIGAEFGSEFSEKGKELVSRSVREMIECCVKQDPVERPGLEQLAKRLEECVEEDIKRKVVC